MVHPRLITSRRARSTNGVGEERCRGLALDLDLGLDLGLDLVLGLALVLDVMGLGLALLRLGLGMFRAVETILRFAVAPQYEDDLVVPKGTHVHVDS